MGKAYVLDRVAADLSQGFTHPAIQRLGSLVAAYPHDLDLRRRLAAVHRRVGNRIQAGRWDYLTIGADAGDTLAFEQAFPSSVARLREVRWPHRAGLAATSYGRSRLAKLAAAAAAERRQGGRPGTWGGGRVVYGAGAAARIWRGALAVATVQSRRALRTLRAQRPWRAAALVGSAVAAGLVVVGTATVIQWLVQ